MFVSKSTLFSIATATLLVTNASAEIVKVSSTGVMNTSGGRRLDITHLPEITFPIDFSGKIDSKTCILEDIQLRFTLEANFTFTATKWELTAVVHDGSETTVVLVNDDMNIPEKTVPAEFNSAPIDYEFTSISRPDNGNDIFTADKAAYFSQVLDNLENQILKEGNPSWTLKISADQANPNIPIKAEELEFFFNCEGSNFNIQTSGVIGDPHFTTFGASHHYDFQGACDLVTVQNNGYKNGKGMHVHVRTTNYGSWSSTTSAAVKIGDDVLEVHGEDLALINGVEYPVPAIVGSEFNFPMTIGDYSLTVQILGPHSRRHIIHMGDGEKIMINNFKEFVDIEFQGDKPEDYNGAVGMLGAFSNHGAMIGRDGKTIFEDADAFGQEWQVRPTDPHLFHVIDGPQYPAHCQMPEQPTAEQRHLRAMSKKVSEDNAKKACAGALKMENCIADVFGSDNLEMANIYTMGNL